MISQKSNMKRVNKYDGTPLWCMHFHNVVAMLVGISVYVLQPLDFL